MNNRQSFTSQQLGEMIIANVDFFVNKTPAHDDLTLASVKKIDLKIKKPDNFLLPGFHLVQLLII